ncbi:MAG: SLBB domain-containing protein, partial [Sediminibacterium sp.]|nr:SLBB domain-containing protein [Sediminibacterium sp.]
ILFSFQANPVFSQDAKNNPQVMAQIRAILTAKGLTEDEVKTRLKTKNIDIDKMTDQEIIAQRPAIEAIINEMEQEKKQKMGAANVIVDTNKIKAIIDSNDEQVGKAKQAEQYAPVVPTREEPKSPNSIYGHHIFKDNTLQAYRISKDASPPDLYILAPGDKINIIIFGKSQADLQYEINPSGYIQPAQMPKIFLSGLTLKSARELLINRFSSFYVFNKDQFALTLNTSRTLNLNIFGEVDRAGSYTTSALNTALNALAVAGGPTNNGSVRKIQIMRGSVKKILDVYAFMQNPILQFDFYLQNNDIIYVPPAEKIITLQGAVNRPMKYELIDNEGIPELISFAGGLQSNVYTEFVQIERFENNAVVIKDYSLDDIQKKKIIVSLKNGDIVRFKSINTMLTEFVSISGAVDYKGSYELNSTKTISALLKKSRLKQESKLDQIFLLRKNPDTSTQIISLNAESILAGKSADFILQKKDSILVYEQSRFVDLFSIAVLGEVRNPFERQFRFDQSISIKEALGLAGELKPTAAFKAYVYRTDPFNAKKTQYIPVSLTDEAGFKLKPGDKLVILNKDTYKLDFNVSIAGEVNNPISIRYDSTLKIKDLIQLAGGVTLGSNLNRVDIFRLKFNKDRAPEKQLMSLTIDQEFNVLSGTQFELQPLDYVVVRRIPEFQLQDFVTINGEVKTPGVYGMTSKRYHFSSLVQQTDGFNEFADVENISLIRYIDSSGLVVFNASDALDNKGNLAKDPILLAGDLITVPKLNNIVKIETSGTRYILGDNQRVLQVNYQGKHSAAWYVRNFAGGFDKRADRISVQVVRENGIVNKTTRFLFFKKYPKVTYGDRVVTTMKPPKPEKTETKGVDWDKFMTRVLAFGSTLGLILAATR